MPEQNDNDLQPTFGNCHGEILPESERVMERKPRRFRKYGQVTDPEKEAEERYWEEAKRRGLEDYKRSEWLRG